MEEINKKNILLLGLPETGKTSFLAALYYVASSGAEDRTMKEYKMSSDSTYLNMIRKQWLGCGKVDRTINVTNTSTKDVVLHLESAKFATQFDLHIPDVAGESFMTQFVDRLWETSYLEEVRNAGGILLFIHPSRLKHHTLIDDIIGAHNALSEIDVGTPDSEATAKPTLEETLTSAEEIQKESVEFTAENCPTQLIMTDLLQNHLDENQIKKLNVAVVVSAWESIVVEKHSPEKWLQLNLPLLFQYLNCNFEKINFKVFGVSALGGDIEKNSEIERLQNCNEPSDRIIVQDGDNTHSDIGIPIEWIIKQWLNEKE